MNYEDSTLKFISICGSNNGQNQPEEISIYLHIFFISNKC